MGDLSWRMHRNTFGGMPWLCECSHPWSPCHDHGEGGTECREALPPCDCTEFRVAVKETPVTPDLEQVHHWSLDRFDILYPPIALSQTSVEFGWERYREMSNGASPDTLIVSMDYLEEAADIARELEPIPPLVTCVRRLPKAAWLLVGKEGIIWSGSPSGKD